MAELLIRAGKSDALMLERLFALGLDAPDRIVVDAHVPATSSDLAAVAGAAGVPFMIDPQTYYFQDVQHASDPWASLPFAEPRAFTANELRNTARLRDIVQEVVEYQLSHNATRIVAPYFHVESASNGWAHAQVLAWRLTAEYLRTNNIALPVTAVVALGWRCLPANIANTNLAHYWAALKDLNPDEVALAASKVHAGVTAQGRLIDLLRLVGRLSQQHRVIMWSQGLLGEICVVGGASGYETGIGWRERCELQTKMGEHRRPSTGHPAARPVYVAAIGRGIPKKTLEALSRGTKTLWRDLVCLDPTCCPPGAAGLLEDARAHDIRSRKRDLSVLAAMPANHWRWTHLSNKAHKGLHIAERINRSRSRLDIDRVDTITLEALVTVAEQQRLRQRAVLPA